MCHSQALFRSSCLLWMPSPMQALMWELSPSHPTILVEKVIMDLGIFIEVCWALGYLENRWNSEMSKERWVFLCTIQVPEAIFSVGLTGGLSLNHMGPVWDHRTLKCEFFPFTCTMLSHLRINHLNYYNDFIHRLKKTQIYMGHCSRALTGLLGYNILS